MPKQATMPDDATDGRTIHPAAMNGMSEGALKGFVAEYEDEQSKIDEIMRNAASACQPHIDQQKAIKKAAAEAGIPKKPFSAKIRERSLKRRAEAVTDSLSEEQKAVFAEISAKLGDWNLFEHALNS